MSIEFTFEGLDDQIAAVAHLTEVDFQTVGALETVLRHAFLDTQARVHVLTGSLKASGHTSSEFDGSEWSGEIVYGGGLMGMPFPGPPNDPVTYAIYEMARGGSHDWFSGLPAFNDAYLAAIRTYLEGGE